MSARNSVTLFRLRGIRVGVDYSWFLVLFLVIIWLSNLYGSALGVSETETYALAVASALAFFGSILLHELGHALVALRRGVGISEITLWLFGGLAHMTRDSDSPGTELRIALAGPLVTLVIAALCTAAGLALAGSREAFADALLLRRGADVSGPAAAFAWLGSVNALVLAFNLVPAFPLDGGRVARAIAWKVTGNRLSATRFAAALGQGFAYVFIALGIVMAVNGALLGGVWLGLIGFVLASSARRAAVETAFSERLAGLRVADAMDPEPIAIPADATVQRALDEYFLRYRWPWFPVTDAAMRFRGLLVRDAADAVPAEARAIRRVDEVFQPDTSGALQVRADAPLEALLGNDTLRRLGALAAVDDDGRLLGVVTIGRVGRVLRDAAGRRNRVG